MIKGSTFFRGAIAIAVIFLLTVSGYRASIAQSSGVELAVDVADFNQDGLLVIFGALRQQGLIGLPIAVGDLNGDGRDDLIFCGMYGSSGAGTRLNNGQINIYLSDGRDSGFVDQAAEPNRFITISGADSGDLIGTSVATGDINGDGINDLIVGAMGDDGFQNGRFNSGAVYVILGSTNFNPPRDLSTITGTPPPGVIVFCGAQANGRTGIWVDSGDINGDGIDDIVMGGDQLGSPTRQHAGGACVVMGSPNLPQVVDLAAVPPGVEMPIIFGARAEEHWGAAVHVGDINDDGIKDVVIGGSIFRDSGSYVTPQDQVSGHNDRGASFGGTRIRCGETYVIYGQTNWPRFTDLSNPPANATRVIGANSGDLLGSQIHSADLNGDGRRDLIIGALQALAPDNRGRTGGVHIVYGQPGIEGATIDFADPSASGFQTSTIYGVNNIDCAGDSVRSFDINRDGKSDLFIGSPVYDSVISGQMRQNAGDTKFIFGQSGFLPEVVKLYDVPPGVRVFQLAGAHGIAQSLDGFQGDQFSYRLAGGDIDGDGYIDYVSNAMHGDGFGNRVINGGNVYIFSGRKLSERLGMLEDDPDPGNGPALDSATLSLNGQTVQQTGAGQAGLRITVNGTDFRDDTQILINGQVVVSRIPDSQQQRATRRTIELDENPSVRDTAGVLLVRARNTAPPSDLSNEVNAGRLTGPEIANIQPRRKNSGLVILKINGANFPNGTTATVIDENDQMVRLKRVNINSNQLMTVKIAIAFAPPRNSTVRVRVATGNVQSNEVSITLP